MSDILTAKYDTVIVGSGAAGIVGGITAAKRGLRPLIIEKSSTWGGTSSYSGGALWIPSNHLQIRDGEDDSVEDALAYLRECVPDEGPSTSEARQRAFLENAPRMLKFLCEEGAGLIREPTQPDYSSTPHSRAGRCIDPVIFNSKSLGKLASAQRLYPGDVYAVSIGELPMVGQGLSTWPGISMMLKVGLRHKLSKLFGKALLGMGSALVAQLMNVAQRLSVPLVLDCRLKRLVIEEGRVTGIDCEYEGRTVRVKAPSGVLLCTGGFAHAPAYRQVYQKVDGAWSSASSDDTGDAVGIAEEIGADIALMDAAWWGCSVIYPGGVPGFTLTERSMPGSIIVDGAGRRFANESQNYNSLGLEMRRVNANPAWLIIDSRHRNRYRFGLMLPGRTPKALIDAGFFIRADSIEELARRCAIDSTTLCKTVKTFNDRARYGEDPEFNRGKSPYENHWGDPSNKPNPNLGPVEKSPFLATRVYPGDLGTRGGFLTDPVGRVTKDGKPIEGLYASGNSTASIFGKGYPGAGSTLAPAMTFAFLAMEDAARRRIDLSPAH